MAGETAPDPQAFIDSYSPEALVMAPNGSPMTLGQVLAFELLCPAPPEKTKDPVRRIQKLATMLAAADSLRPEDRHLLPPPPAE